MNFRNIAAALTLALLTACGGGGGSSGPSGSGSVEILATDAPFAHDIVVSADIWVREVQIRDAGGFTTLYDGAPILLDLANLRNGLTRQLVAANVPAGSYDQIRLIVQRARLELVDGDVFDSDLGTMNLTSTDTAGLKLDIQPALAVTDGVARTVLLDFDLTKTFHAVPGNDPLNATSYSLMPVVHVSNESDSGEVRGVVREDDGAGGFIGVADATVYLLLPGETDPQSAVRTTASETGGTYAFLGVPAGNYDLLAELGARQDRSDGHTVLLGSVTTVDFVLP